MAVSHPRQAIVEAAYGVLAEHGVRATSIKEIARAAGVAPGLIHYYFTNKEALLAAVLQEASDRYTREMVALRAAVPTEQLTASGLAAPQERVSRQPEWYRLRYELFALGLHTPALMPGIGRLLDGGRVGIAAMLSAASGKPADDPDMVALAALLLACFDGLALQQLADPAFDLARAYSAVERLTRTFLAED